MGERVQTVSGQRGAHLRAELVLERSYELSCAEGLGLLGGVPTPVKHLLGASWKLVGLRLL